MKTLEATVADPEFWTQTDREKTLQELKRVRGQAEPFLVLQKDAADLAGMLTITEESDAQSLKHLETEVTRLKSALDALEFQRLLSGPEDPSSAIISINAGAGGTEACDWVAMLMRMYTRWAESKGFKTQIIDILPGEEAGIKNVTMLFQGDYAYGYLKAERGVHRLVRISPFDSNKRRHTSFASVEVIPEIDEDIKIDVKEAELRIDVFRAGGHGGQGVNTTDSAVRITHLPSGIVVQCQNERSQLKNKATALKVLKSRLHEREMNRRQEAAQKNYDSKQEIAWGSQIRSYVLYPYKMVKDHRTDHETSNTAAVLDGDIQGFIEAFLKHKES